MAMFLSWKVLAASLALVSQAAFAATDQQVVSIDNMVTGITPNERWVAAAIENARLVCRGHELCVVYGIMKERVSDGIGTVYAYRNPDGTLNALGRDGMIFTYVRSKKDEIFILNCDATLDPTMRLREAQSVIEYSNCLSLSNVPLFYSSVPDDDSISKLEAGLKVHPLPDDI